MAIHPGMVEDLAAGTRALYADAEERLLGIIGRQLAAGWDAPQWAERKLSAVQSLRRASQGVVDELARATSLEVFEVVAEAYNTGHRAGVAELGALDDDARRRVDEITPQAAAVDRLAAETVDLLTQTHRSILRAVDDGYRAVVAEVTATPLLGVDTRRQATQDAMRRFADRGIRTFTDRSGRRWGMTSYAEMAVRTSVGRAATEAHMRTLETAGVELVTVSNAPRECPLCRPYEGKVLSISGPDGARTVEVEHATEDGRMVRVRIAGSLDGARRKGLQHPNCRHSVSAYTPGITRTDTAEPDPAGYEAGQRQRAIERNIRKHKNRAAAATTPEAKRAAEAKVRQHQRAMRDHLAAHPDLRRLRHREQPGASNLPTTARTAPPDHMQAARIRSGDQLTPAEMSDEQLGAAMRSGSLDARDRARVEAEADRRDTAALLDRARPGGQLADDLTPFSDDELARLHAHLDDHETVRLLAEMNRRDVAARMPDVRRDLVGLSDEQLAQRSRRADPAELDALAEEANRRDMLAQVFPGGRLADDLDTIGDDQLSWAVQYAEPDEAARIAAEFDRRYPPAPLPAPAASGDAVLDAIADRTAIARALDPMPDPEDWGWLADDDEAAAVLGRAARRDDDTAPPAGATTAAEHTARAARDDEEDEPPRITRRQARQMYDEYVYQQYLKAEEDCRGYLLNKKYETSGVSPESLFSGPARIAYARASDELKEWWAEHGRLTQAEFIEQATGQRQRWAEGARLNEAERQNRR